MKNITFSASEELIEQARQIARVRLVRGAVSTGAAIGREMQEFVRARGLDRPERRIALAAGRRR